MDKSSKPSSFHSGDNHTRTKGPVTVQDLTGEKGKDDISYYVWW